MKKLVVLITLISLGYFQTCLPWNVSYAMKNDMLNPTTKAVFNFSYKKAEGEGTYQAIIDDTNKPNGIQPGEIFGWTWDNEQNIYTRRGHGSGWSKQDAYITSVTVNWLEPDPKNPSSKMIEKSKTTPQDKIYGDMDWLIRKDGSLIRLKNGSLANRDNINRIEDDGNNKTGTVVLKDGTRIPFQ